MVLECTTENSEEINDLFLMKLELQNHQAVRIQLVTQLNVKKLQILRENLRKLYWKSSLILQSTDYMPL